MVNFIYTFTYLLLAWPCVAVGFICGFIYHNFRIGVVGHDLTAQLIAAEIKDKKGSKRKLHRQFYILLN